MKFFEGFFDLKKNMRAFIEFAVPVLLLGGFVYGVHIHVPKSERVNIDKIAKALETRDEVPLTDLTDFDWDTFCVMAEWAFAYATEEEIARMDRFKGDPRETIRSLPRMNPLFGFLTPDYMGGYLFLKDGKVVTYWLFREHWLPIRGKRYFVDGDPDGCLKRSENVRLKLETRHTTDYLAIQKTRR